MEFGNHVEKAVDFIAETPLFKLITGQDTGQGSGNSIFASIKGFATERLGLGNRISESFSSIPNAVMGGVSNGGVYVDPTPSLGDKLSPETRNLVANLDFGSTLKNGVASEGARYSLTKTVEAATNVGYEPVNISVVENNFSPAATPNPRFGQQPQAGMAVG